MLRSGKNIIIFIFIFCCTSYNLWRNWGGSRHPFTSDVAQYYSYIDAFLIHHDPSFNFQTSYWLHPTPAGHSVPQMSMGLALVLTPAFLLCHGVAFLTGEPMDGYSNPYAFGLYYYGILFVLFGLYVLRKILLQFYSEKISSLVLLTLFFGTNLFYYTLGSSLMTHGFLFTLYAGILFYTIQWHKQYEAKPILVLGFLCGLCTLIRPTSVFVLFVPFLYGVTGTNSLKQRIVTLWRYKVQLLAAAIMFMIPWLPQMLYWKIYAGSWMYYSYGEQGFDFLHPQIINVLFSFRKGWLLYTPLMAFALVGFYFLFQTARGLFWPVFIFFVVTFYVLCCWWCWSWGGSFGIRAFVESYAFLSLPLAAMYRYLFEQKKYKACYYVIAFLCCFNLYQTYQYKAVVIHWDNTTKESYFYGLFKLSYTPEERARFNTLIETHSDTTFVIRKKNE